MFYSYDDFVMWFYVIKNYRKNFKIYTWLISNICYNDKCQATQKQFLKNKKYYLTNNKVYDTLDTSQVYNIFQDKQCSDTWKKLKLLLDKNQARWYTCIKSNDLFKLIAYIKGCNLEK